MNKLCSGLLCLALALPAAAQDSIAFQNEDQKTLYALGVWLSQKVTVFNLNSDEYRFVQLGLKDAVLGAKPQVDLNQYGSKLNDLAQKRMAVKAEGQKKADSAFLKKAGQEKGAKAFPSGLVYMDLKAGSGKSPKATDKVKVHYRGTLTDGKVFDSSYDRGEPAQFPLNGVIPCWTEGVQKMKVGGKAKLVCPSAIAYGDSGSPPLIPGGATLVFEVELLEIL